MTQSEALQVFGSQITGTYFSSVTNDYESFTLSYVQPWTYAYGVHSAGNSWTYEGSTFLLYTATGLAISSNPQYISLDIQPTYSFFDTEQIHTVIAIHSGGESAGISTIFQSPSWDWYFNGSSVHLENIDESENTGTHAFIRTDGRAYQYVCADFMSTTATSGYSYRATFYGHSGSYCYLLIGIPYVSDSSSGASGTFTTASGGGSGGDINVNVDVDLSGVESRLDAVQSGLGDVAERVSDAVDGVNDIKDAINAAQGDSLASVEDVGVPPLPFDESTVDDVGEMLNDVPEEVAAGGFWWSLAFDVLHFSSPYWLIVPLICLLALMRYLLWRG